MISKTDTCGQGQNETLVKDALEKQRKPRSQTTALNTPPKPRRKQLIFDNMLLDYCRFWHYSDPFLKPLCNVLRPLDSHLKGKNNNNTENKLKSSVAKRFSADSTRRIRKTVRIEHLPVRAATLVSYVPRGRVSG